MHASVLAWFRTSVTRGEIEGRRVLEVGSFNVNGSVRPIVTAHHPAEYRGVDAAPGDGVDQVLDCTGLVDEFGPGSWDVVISTEMLEHVEDWRASIRSLFQVMAPGGLLIVTTRSPGFPYHPFPGDFWRFTLAAVDRMVRNARLEVLEISEDPEAPGVFLKARKPDDWRLPRGNPWAGVDVQPVRQPQPKEFVMPASAGDNKMVAALLRERAGYESAGKADRVALVDEQLKFHGYETEQKPDPKKQAPQGRSAKPQQTGD
jgi:SAM-dependent methyltransferase